MDKKTILVITDGIGYCKRKKFNAFEKANKPNYDYLLNNIPYGMIDTSGLSVGLPKGQMGNSEVGHMTIGSGRILYQDLVKINLAIKNNTLKDNKVINNLLKKSNNIHIIGLLSDGGVHSHINHFIENAKIAENSGKKVFLHLITDGRDVAPKSAKIYIEKIESICNDNIQIASIGGRFFTMDRDNRWDRIEFGYKAIIDAHIKTNNTPLDYVDLNYNAEKTDEFIQPIAFENYSGVLENDGLIFINFRSDRMREIVKAIGDKDFDEFRRDFKSINIITQTEYNKDFNYPIIFKKDKPKNTLAEVISNAGLTQVHIAETEKYAHVTFFLNGGIEKPFKNEIRELIESPKVTTYDEKPEMSALEVGKIVLKSIDKKIDFIVVNFANGDMVGHTGNLDAGIKAVETVDTELGKIIKKAKEENYNLIITSDHGNCEEMKDKNGNILTNHTTGTVWGFILADDVKKVKNGGLNNIAPTILKLMGLDIPKEMDNYLI